MSEQPRQLELTDLRKKYGQQMPDGTGRWIYRPEVLRAEGGLRPHDQIIGLINQQPVEEVCEQFDSAVRQLLYRAHTGDERVAKLLMARIGSAIESLKRLVDGQHSMMQSIAEKSPRWPVMLSLNPKDIAFAKEQLAELKVGSKATTPTHSGQQSDLHAFWSVLAKRAYEVCEFNRQFVPFLLKQAAGGSTENKSAQYWGKQVNATFYYVPGGRNIIIVADWQAQCAALPPEISENTFPPWWNAISGCLLEYWRNHVAKYEGALNVIGNKGESESRRRNLAMTQLRQAFKSLVGLRRTKRAVPFPKE